MQAQHSHDPHRDDGSKQHIITTCEVRQAMIAYAKDPAQPGLNDSVKNGQSEGPIVA